MDIVVPLSLVITEAPVDAQVRVVLDLADEVDLSRLLCVDILVEAFKVLVDYLIFFGGRADASHRRCPRKVLVDLIFRVGEATGPFRNVVQPVVFSELVDVQHHIFLRESLSSVHSLLIINIKLRLLQVLPPKRLVTRTVQLVAVVQSR